MSCREEQILLVSPSIKIESARPISLTSFEVVMLINKGEGQIIEKAEIVLDDITVSSATDILMNIQLTEEKEQIVTIVINTDRLDHDFFAKASLKTDKYTYYSEPVIMRSNKNTFSIDILTDGLYSDLQNNIALFVNKGGRVGLVAHFINQFTPKSVEIKLNRSIPVAHTLNFKDYWYGESLETAGSFTIPSNIDPGIYGIYVYIDGIEFKTECNIKVLNGKWQKINPNYPGLLGKGEYASFVKGDNVYVIGGRFIASTLDESPVWKYTITTNLWERKRNFPHPGNITKNQIFPYNHQYKDEAYIVLKNSDSIDIWKYKDVNDEWSFVTRYPGKSNSEITSFISKGKLYIGGGGYYDPINIRITYYTDLWAYDFETARWIKKKDIPILHNSNKGNLSCNTPTGDVFVFSYANELWHYDPDNDLWTQKKKFQGKIRFLSNMVEKDNKLYLIGGAYFNPDSYGLKDCWEYSIKSNSWELVAYLPERYSYGIAFTFNDKIYAGLGETVLGFNGIYEQNFYQLDI